MKKGAFVISTVLLFLPNLWSAPGYELVTETLTFLEKKTKTSCELSDWRFLSNHAKVGSILGYRCGKKATVEFQLHREAYVFRIDVKASKNILGKTGGKDYQGVLIRPIEKLYGYTCEPSNSLNFKCKNESQLIPIAVSETLAPPQYRLSVHIDRGF